MKKSFHLGLFLLLFVAASMLLSSALFTSDHNSENQTSAVNTASYKQIDFRINAQTSKEKASCGFLMDVNVGTGDSYYSKTSSSVGSCTDIESCITYGGGSGSFYTVYTEIPSGGGSPTVKYNKLVTAPWSGCAHAIYDPPVFSVSANSQVKVEVFSNTGVASTHQVDAN